jgi:hypothetical protein
MRPSGLVTLETSGADSSGLTEAVAEISGSVDVRLSEQQVVVSAFVFGLDSLPARDDAGISDRALSRSSRHPNRNPILLDLPSRIPRASLGEPER